MKRSWISDGVSGWSSPSVTVTVPSATGTTAFNGGGNVDGGDNTSGSLEIDGSGLSSVDTSAAS